MDKMIDKEKEATKPCGIKKGGIYADVNISKRSANLLVVVCGLVFILAVVLMVVL